MGSNVQDTMYIYELTNTEGSLLEELKSLFHNTENAKQAT